MQNKKQILIGVTTALLLAGQSYSHSRLSSSECLNLEDTFQKVSTYPADWQLKMEDIEIRKGSSGPKATLVSSRVAKLAVGAAAKQTTCSSVMIGSAAKSNKFQGVFGFSFKTIASSPQKLVLLNPIGRGDAARAVVYEQSIENGKNLLLARQYTIYDSDTSTPEKIARLGKVLLDFPKDSFVSQKKVN